MRLKNIKLAGFKSFVDPTTVNFPANLTAVVGPNGCGKSNIIDAVRWVMGESSAKTLRGESMTDVIFSGSNGRMPVGQASIELLFDNSDGTLKGEYGAYSEISIRRTVSRELQSIYYLNGSRCRRRDIQDVFLGTGLGPRSYSIIEQGMISRFVEAKPEELRVFIEEAAGISKYKERRRETENRIRHTRENLERLSDIREELDRQLHHLQRQAKAAEQYSEFKQQERDLKAELQAIRWQVLNAGYAEQEQQITQQDIELEAAHAEQRALEAGIEKQREAHTDANEGFHKVQGDLYQVGAEIARQEQNIQHQKERARQLEDDLAAAVRNWNEASADLQADQSRIDKLQSMLAEIEPELVQLAERDQASNAALQAVDAAMNEWQKTWDEFQAKSSQPRQRAEVEQSRIQHIEQSIGRWDQRLEKFETERVSLGNNPEDARILTLETQLAELEAKEQEQREGLSGIVSTIEQQREANASLSYELDQARRKMQEDQGRFASLDELQQSALGQKDTPVLEWLERNQLQRRQRLAQAVKVDKGWEAAVEVVLGSHLQGVCVDDIGTMAQALGGLAKGAITLVGGAAGSEPAVAGAPTLLVAKISGKIDLGSLLAGVYAMDDLDAAKGYQAKLAPHESMVTRDGIWLGPGWLRVSRDSDESGSVLARQEELDQLRVQIAELDEQVEMLGVDQDAGLLKLKNHEQLRESAQRELDVLTRQETDIKSQLSAKKARVEQLNVRKQRIEHDMEEAQEQMGQDKTRLAEARETWQQCLNAIEEDVGLRDTLLNERDQLREQLGTAREQARRDKDQAHQCALRKESVTTQLDALNKGMQRLQSQVSNLSERQAGLQQNIESSGVPMVELQQALDEKLQQRLAFEEALSAARKTVEQVEHTLHQAEQGRIKVERKVEGVRGQLEQLKLQSQGLRVQRETLEQQLQEMRRDLKVLLEQLPEQAVASEWEEKIDKIQGRIQRLGAINLAAIEEYKTQSERKGYLDAQNDDLEQALETLENAIRKIDRETRTKFKTTFDQVNKGLQEIFPKVFGGGHAYLELTGEDLLDTGVTVMARPPGKRNSTIHLLSGGEKALTAISMVFSIFQLNPAPFCMLDEVDAPLDDANVARFCQIVEEMSAHVQFIFITHNKVTMEMANHLMGVTMHEPGVSRLVSVDIDEAAAMAVG